MIDSAWDGPKMVGVGFTAGSGWLLRAEDRSAEIRDRAWAGGVARRTQ